MHRKKTNLLLFKMFNKGLCPVIQRFQWEIVLPLKKLSGARRLRGGGLLNLVIKIQKLPVRGAFLYPMFKNHRSGPGFLFLPQFPSLFIRQNLNLLGKKTPLKKTVSL